MNPNDTKLTDFDLKELQIFEALVCREILLSRPRFSELTKDHSDYYRLDALTKLRVRLLLAINELKNEQTINSN